MLHPTREVNSTRVAAVRPRVFARPSPANRGPAPTCNTVVAQRFEACLKSFARHAFGRAGPRQIRYAAFALAEVPIAAVKPHLQRREPPPPLVDELIIKTYRAIVDDTAAR